MLNANYSHLASYKWELGNGVIRTDKNVIYYYKSPGKYKIKLTVNDMCGQRVYTRTVKFETPPKPIVKKKSKPSKKGNVKRKN
jgi:PKD repeat protein